VVHELGKAIAIDKFKKAIVNNIVWGVVVKPVNIWQVKIT